MHWAVPCMVLRELNADVSSNTIIYPWGTTTSDVIWGSWVIHVHNALSICLYYSIMLIPFVSFMISKAAYMKQIKNIN